MFVSSVKFANIAQHKAQPFAQNRFEAFTQFECAIDHRRRRVDPDREAASATTAPEFDRVLASAAAQVNDPAYDAPLCAPGFEPRHHRVEGLGAITAKPVI